MWKHCLSSQSRCGKNIIRLAVLNQMIGHPFFLNFDSKDSVPFRGIVAATALYVAALVIQWA